MYIQYHVPNTCLQYIRQNKLYYVQKHNIYLENVDIGKDFNQIEVRILQNVNYCEVNNIE